MTYVGDMQASENARAVQRAKTALKPGDRLRVGACGNSRGVTVTMTGWLDDGYIRTKTFDADEVHPINIRKVNGAPMSFADGGHFEPRMKVATPSSGRPL